MNQFVMIGHVDSGKSTISGHLLYQCQYLSEHEMEMLTKQAKEDKMETWKYARILDEYEEERLRGKTMDYNKIQFTYNNHDFVLIDTPGHKQFIRAMLQGVSSEPSSSLIACLVISMAKGEFESGFEKGQTKEHLKLVRAIGITNLIILINKMDLINWDQNIFNEYVTILMSFVRKLRFKNIKIIPVSGYQGIGLISKDNMPNWYNGNCLIDEILTMTKSLTIANESINLKCCQFPANIQILYCPTIISRGYSFVLHIGSKELNATIESMKDKIFIKEGEMAVCNILLPYESELTTKRFIMRNGDETIGYGIIN